MPVQSPRVSSGIVPAAAAAALETQQKNGRFPEWPRPDSKRRHRRLKQHDASQVKDAPRGTHSTEVDQCLGQ